MLKVFWVLPLAIRNPWQLGLTVGRDGEWLQEPHPTIQWLVIMDSHSRVWCCIYPPSKYAWFFPLLDWSHERGVWQAWRTKSPSRFIKWCMLHAGTLLVSGNGWILHCKVHAVHGRTNWSQHIQNRLKVISCLETQFMAETWSLQSLWYICFYLMRSWRSCSSVRPCQHPARFLSTTNPTPFRGSKPPAVYWVSWWYFLEQDATHQ